MNSWIWLLLIIAAIWWWNSQKKRREELRRREAERRLRTQAGRKQDIIDIEPEKDQDEGG